MKSYKSAMGKNVDMGALMAKNETVRAVGNMQVNARGDDIDSHGRIIKPVTSKVNQAYSRTVGNRSGQVVKKPAQPAQKIEADTVKLPEPEVVEELSQVEVELEAEFDDDELTEQIKAAELQAEAEKAKKAKK